MSFRLRRRTDRIAERITGRQSRRNASKYGLSRPRQNSHAACFVALSLSAVLITVCIAPSLSNAEPEGYSVIRVGTVKIPDDFNPFEATTSLSHSIIWMTYEMLHTTGPDLTPYPQLAESYMVSEDGKKWTFNLSADSYWHDGLPVTAHDANFTFNMILRNEAECGLLGGYLQNVTDVRALDDHTLQVTTDVAKSTMLSINVPSCQNTFGARSSKMK